jgi:hypothetical protein
MKIGSSHVATQEQNGVLQKIALKEADFKKRQLD